ncbi:hypothetical protein HDU67_004662, partial [Dinochytrium kinnereticum]
MARIISNLAAIGYDNNNMHLASYDWRLSVANLEVRDMFFTKLKTTIELAYRANMNTSMPRNSKDDHSRVVIVSHSMGSVLTHYFLQWVESDRGGGGGKEWVDKYLKTWVNIGGPLLGTPKTLPSVLSGEMKDTVNLNAYASYAVEQFFSRKERRNLFRNWGAMNTLHPKGGEHIWGSLSNTAPDDLKNTGKFGSLLEITKKPSASRPPKVLFPAASASPLTTALNSFAENANDTEDSINEVFNVTAANMIEFFARNVGDPGYGDKWANDHAAHVAESDEEVQRATSEPRYWLNPLLCPLPHISDLRDKASRFKIICEYGVGIPTERKYFYADYGEDPAGERYLIDTSLQDPPNVVNGVLLTDGFDSCDMKKMAKI